MRSIRLHPPSGFTLIEMLVSVVVLLIIMGIIFQITSETGSLWKGTTAKIQAFQAARAGFESMSRRISQATLNTYYDYFDSSYNRVLPLLIQELLIPMVVSRSSTSFPARPC